MSLLTCCATVLRRTCSKAELISALFSFCWATLPFSQLKPIRTALRPTFVRRSKNPIPAGRRKPMKRNNQPALRIELIPSPATLHRERTGFDKAELTRLVQEKVAEIMAERDAIVFEPFFRSRQVACELKRLQNIPEQQKFTVSFERYGCMICETRERIHGGNGMCTLCHAKWFARLTQIIAEGIKGEPARTARGTKLDQRL